MRISELSRVSGVSLPTVKYYLREGLLPAGRATGRNQAEYTDAHLRRLRLIRALIDVGNLSVAGVRQVLQAVDDTDLPGHELLGVAHEAVAGTPRADRDTPAWHDARAEAARFATTRGWHVRDHAPALDQLADAVAALRELDQQDMLPLLDDYADAVERLAPREVGLVLARGDRAAMVEGVVTGTVLGETMLTALRRLAQEHTSAQFSPAPET